MSITSPGFFLFAALLILLYYLLPKRLQWILLLAASVCFYLLAGWKFGIFLLVTALSVYGAALWIAAEAKRKTDYLRANKQTLSKEERKAYSARSGKRQRRILAAALILNFGILCVFKYTGFFVFQLDRLFGGHRADAFSRWIVPLGISFYTFQSAGYLADVYWGRCEAQRSFPRFLLFVCFFPQILQGPISSYGQLSGELYRPHPFDFDNLGHGLRRMLWGYFKKLVIADAIAPYVTHLFQHYPTYAGPAAFVGIVLYSIQLYADFSGYMDIVCGLSRILGITLRENFDRPFFAGSVAEYWRRWHMSLGDWFKAYVYYPIAVSGWAQKLGKAAKKRIGKAVGSVLPATIALIVTWLTTGLWHGASWAYIAWGGLNGAFLIVSIWMEPLNKRLNARLRLTRENRLWQVFRVLRTNLILVFLRILPEVGGLRDGLGLWARVFRGPFRPGGWQGWFPGGTNPLQILIPFFGFGLMMAVDGIKCRQPAQEWMDRRPLLLRFGLYFLLIGLILIFGCYGEGYDARAFMYFKF